VGCITTPYLKSTLRDLCGGLEFRVKKASLQVVAERMGRVSRQLQCGRPDPDTTHHACDGLR
jgi:hypothetical protein